MKTKVEYSVQKLSIDELMRFFYEEKVEGYCKNCPNYNKRYTCPPFEFSKIEYIRKFNQVFIIGSKWYKEDIPKELWDKNKILDAFESMREQVSKIVLDYEKEILGSEALLIGTCTNCEICNKVIDKPCKNKQKQRYSLEALGFLVSDIAKNVLNTEILWQKEGMIDYHFSVSAILLKSEENIENLKKYLDKNREFEIFFKKSKYKKRE